MHIPDIALHAAKLIQQRTELRPAIGVVLGSGVGEFANQLDNRVPLFPAIRASLLLASTRGFPLLC